MESVEIYEPTLDEIGLRYVENFSAKRGKVYLGGDKTSVGHYFTKTYHEYLNSIRNKEVSLLELGIFQGRSIAMWSDYFPNGKIYGVDINLNQFNKTKAALEKMGAFKNNNTELFKFDITKQPFFDWIDSGPTYDIIVDDALHKPKTQYENFVNLFPKLNKGGIYFIEDIVKPVGFFNEFKTIFEIASNKKSNHSVKNKLNYITNKIESIEIRSNLVIITKS